MSAFFYFCDTYSTLYKTLQFPAHIGRYPFTLPPGLSKKKQKINQNWMLTDTKSDYPIRNLFATASTPTALSWSRPVNKHLHTALLALH